MSILNKMEAPAGFYAVEKPASSDSLPNICAACDWRPECSSGKADFTKINHRCMSFPILSSETGEVISRSDGKSVIFKRIEEL